jgi:hypothetical protein
VVCEVTAIGSNKFSGKLSGELKTFKGLSADYRRHAKYAFSRFKKSVLPMTRILTNG